MSSTNDSFFHSRPEVYTSDFRIILLTAVKRLMNREKRQNQIYFHKVSILCWVGHGTFLNRTISNPALVQLTIKRLLPSASCRPKGLTNSQHFQQVTHYFRKVVKLKNNDMYFRSSNLPPLQATLKYQIMQRSAFLKRDYILLFLLMRRKRKKVDKSSSDSDDSNDFPDDYDGESDDAKRTRGELNCTIWTCPTILSTTTR